VAWGGVGMVSFFGLNVGGPWHVLRVEALYSCTGRGGAGLASLL
jgi:hypothetical protein